MEACGSWAAPALRRNGPQDKVMARPPPFGADAGVSLFLRRLSIRLPATKCFLRWRGPHARLCGADCEPLSAGVPVPVRAGRIMGWAGRMAIRRGFRRCWDLPDQD